MAEVPVVPQRIVRVEVQTLPNGVTKFNPERIKVQAGQQVEIILHNAEAPNSGISHNWVLIKPGTSSAVEALGKQAGVDPDAVTYSPAIMAATRTTRPGSLGIVDFLAPEIPGEYPFLSLVGSQPKHLRGTLVVLPIDPLTG
jgi:azurin